MNLFCLKPKEAVTGYHQSPFPIMREVGLSMYSIMCTRLSLEYHYINNDRLKYSHMYNNENGEIYSACMKARTYKHYTTPNAPHQQSYKMG